MNGKFFALILCCSLGDIAFAKDFGKQGMTFEVKEEGFVAMMQRRLKDVNSPEHEQKMKDLVKKRVEEPVPVSSITRATKTVSHSYDPTYVLDEDVVLPCGKLLYPQGTRVNPLDHMSWDGTLVFIDGRDKEQIEWAVKNYFKVLHTSEAKDNIKGQSSTINLASLVSSDEKDNNDGSKIVLIAGRPLDLEKKTGSSIYFDQAGVLTKKFNIAHVPAIVKQDGKYLKITEINIEAKQ